MTFVTSLKHELRGIMVITLCFFIMWRLFIQYGFDTETVDDIEVIAVHVLAAVTFWGIRGTEGGNVNWKTCGVGLLIDIVLCGIGLGTVYGMKEVGEKVTEMLEEMPTYQRVGTETLLSATLVAFIHIIFNACFLFGFLVKGIHDTWDDDMNDEEFKLQIAKANRARNRATTKWSQQQKTKTTVRKSYDVDAIRVKNMFNNEKKGSNSDFLKKVNLDRARADKGRVLWTAKAFDSPGQARP